MTSTAALLESMHAADRSVHDPVAAALPALSRAVAAIAARMRSGGRCFYQGAGTSGRLAVLDAAELGPTFGVDSNRVIALIAGGSRAVTDAIEGAEDDPNAAVADLEQHGVSALDAVVGIAASGTTPYTLAGLRHAKARGALTVAIACAPKSPLATLADIAIELDVGPEVLVGSTRLKAGTAQKLTLNMLSTCVMNELGLIYRGRMVAMRPTNHKLRERAVNIMHELTGATGDVARSLLESSEWSLPHALLRAKHGLDAGAARAHLDHHRGSVRDALDCPPGSTR